MDASPASVYSRDVQDAKTDKANASPEPEPGAGSGTGTDADRERDADSAAPSATRRDPARTQSLPIETTHTDEPRVENATDPMSDGDRLRNLALFVPRLLQLIGRLVADSDVPLVDKVILGAAAAYVVSPLDLLPDAVPLLGQLDDIYLIAICLLRLMHRSGEAKLRQHWDGPEDIVQILHTVTDVATRYLPGGLRTRLRGWVEAKPST